MQARMEEVTRGGKIDSQLEYHTLVLVGKNQIRRVWISPRLQHSEQVWVDNCVLRCVELEILTKYAVEMSQIFQRQDRTNAWF